MKYGVEMWSYCKFVMIYSMEIQELLQKCIRIISEQL